MVPPKESISQSTVMLAVAQLDAHLSSTKTMPSLNRLCIALYEPGNYTRATIIQEMEAVLPKTTERGILEISIIDDPDVGRVNDSRCSYSNSA